MLVLVEKAEVVLLVGLRLLEQGLLLGQHHFGVVSTCLARGDADMDRRGGCRRLIINCVFLWDVRSSDLLMLAGNNSGISVFCLDKTLCQMDLELEEAMKNVVRRGGGWMQL